MIAAAFLDRLARRCRAGEPLDPVDAVALAVAVQDIASGRCRGLDEALGLKPAAGQRSIGAELARLRRNDLLRAWATRFYPHLTGHGQGSAIAVLLHRYETSAWRHDRQRSEMPTGYQGAEREYCYRVCRLDLPLPQARQIARIVMSSGVSCHAGGSTTSGVEQPERVHNVDARGQGDG